MCSAWGRKVVGGGLCKLCLFAEVEFKLSRACTLSLPTAANGVDDVATTSYVQQDRLCFVSCRTGIWGWLQVQWLVGWERYAIENPGMT